jgi:hypothetical protein
MVRSGYVIAAVLSLVVMAGVADAATVRWVGSTYQSGSGGEFLFRVTDDSGDLDPYFNVGDEFATFCIETNEYLSKDTDYYVVLNIEAVKGGVGGGSPDPLCNETKYLYFNYWEGTLSNYDYANSSGDRLSDAGQLQNAIWYFENEGAAPASGTEGAAWVTEAINAVKPVSEGGGGWTDTQYVRVLNLYTNSSMTAFVQDQLVVIDRGPQNFVPLPAAVWMGGILLLGLGASRRLRNRKS